MQKKRLGISVYPERGTDEQNIRYMETAAKHGFDVLFIALLAVHDGREAAIERYKPLTWKAKKLGFEVIADVNPMVFKHLGVNASFFSGPLDLSFFTELKVDVLRLDLGLNDMEEAYLSKNKAGIKICLNGCNKYDHVGHVLGAGGDRERIMGCHNYYPHRYTGTTLANFQAGSEPFRKHHMRLEAFVSSQNPEAFGPWPVTEGLPTLEMHRDWPIQVQVKHFILMGFIDDIIIGNCYATEDELRAMEQANQEKVTFHMTPAAGLPENMAERLRMDLSVRGDSGDWLIRSIESRMLRTGPIEPFNTVDIQTGDVLIDNDLYGQYSGEVQIARQPMKNSGKTNVVGHIDDVETNLLPYMVGSTPFAFDF